MAGKEDEFFRWLRRNLHLLKWLTGNCLLFIWVVKSQEVNLDIRALCSLHEMHCQFKNKMVNGTKVINCFGCCSFKPCRGAKQISPATENKWNDDSAKYWFYHKVPMVEEREKEP
jgi:hypothetical protein